MSALFTLPELRDCRRLFLRAHELPVRIGVHDFEQHAAQRVVFNVDLFVQLADSTPRSDRLEEVVDYDFIRDVIAGCAGGGQVGLQETLCDAIAARLLAHPQVRAVRVATEKPDVYPDCAAVGVEVFHLKQEPTA